MQTANDRSELEQDGFRLLGLSRIPRCASCRRLRALREAFDHGVALLQPLPPVPAGCRHQICAPLVRRFARG